MDPLTYFSFLFIDALMSYCLMIGIKLDTFSLIFCCNAPTSTLIFCEFILLWILFFNGEKSNWGLYDLIRSFSFPYTSATIPMGLIFFIASAIFYWIPEVSIVVAIFESSDSTFCFTYEDLFCCYFNIV